MKRIAILLGLSLVLAACGGVADTTTTIEEIPDVIGLRLNAAEDVLAKADVSSTHFDAMSERVTLNKSNWIVFSQDTAGDRAVSLGVVKQGEDPNAPPTTTTTEPPTSTTEGSTTTSEGSATTTVPGSELTRSEENAIRSAESYLDFTAFSRSGLIGQLEFEGFTTAEATFAVDFLNVNWNEQATLSAESYLEFTAFSESGLIAQLEFEGFSPEEAIFGVTSLTVDWNEQAWKSAESYLEFSSFSRSGLIDQLEFEGFTTEQATYGVDKAGL